MTCNQCAELREEIAWLKQRLGEQEDDKLLWSLMNLFGLTRCEARLVRRLHQTRGPVGRDALTEASATDAHRDYSSNLVQIFVLRARRKLGALDTIDTMRGYGYVLSDKGRQVIDQALETGVTPRSLPDAARGRTWPPERLEALQALRKAGFTWSGCAARMNLSRSAVYNAALRYDLSA